MNKVIVLLLLVIFVSCQPEGRIYVEHQKLSPDVEWLKEDTKEFILPVEDKDMKYKMSLSFRYATGYQFKTAKVKLLEISPSGKEQTFRYSLKIREENGEYIGDPGYDIWDGEHMIESQKQFEEIGEYTYVIGHEMPNDPLYFAMEIGIILDQTNK